MADEIPELLPQNRSRGKDEGIGTKKACQTIYKRRQLY
jgi:hypothetical protein